MKVEEKELLLNEITNRLVKGLSPSAIYLFGSFASNTETEDSDIDILIEKATSKRKIDRYHSVRGLLKGLPYPFDLLIYTPSEIKDRSKDKYSVIYQALNNGKKLYEKK